MAKLVQNPFQEPILHFYNDLKSTEWEIPFVPQIIKSIVLITLLVLFPFFYISIGVISQVSSLLWDMIKESKDKFRDASLIDSSGFIIANAIYFILFIPLWIIQLPFILIGSLSNKNAVIILLILIAIAIIIYFLEGF